MSGIEFKTWCRCRSSLAIRRYIAFSIAYRQNNASSPNPDASHGLGHYYASSWVIVVDASNGTLVSVAPASRALDGAGVGVKSRLSICALKPGAAPRTLLLASNNDTHEEGPVFEYAWDGDDATHLDGDDTVGSSDAAFAPTSERAASTVEGAAAAEESGAAGEAKNSSASHHATWAARGHHSATWDGAGRDAEQKTVMEVGGGGVFTTLAGGSKQNCHDVQRSAEATVEADGGRTSVWGPQLNSEFSVNSTGIRRVADDDGSILFACNIPGASDINHVQLVENDTIAYVSDRMYSAVMKVRMTLGDGGAFAHDQCVVEWSIGGANGDFELIDERGVRHPRGTMLWRWQHNAEFFGENTLYLVDNEYRESGLEDDEFPHATLDSNSSRFVRLAIDEAQRVAIITWTFDLHACVRAARCARARAR